MHLPLKPPSVARLDSVGGTEVRWLWHRHIPLGKLTIIAGQPGVGKSTVAAHFAAIVSSGGNWPETPSQPDPHDIAFQPGYFLRRPASQPPSNVLLFASEDNVADTIAPRLQALEADRSKIYVSTQQTPLDETVFIESALRRADIDAPGQCPLIIIDPVASFLHGVGGQSASGIHRRLAPLNDFAAKHNVAVVCITHLTASARTSAVARVHGGLGVTAAARSVWIIAEDPVRPQRRLFLPAKNNVGGITHGHAFTLQPIDSFPDVAIPVWEPGPVQQSANEVLGQPLFRRPVSQAESWLQAVLSVGPRCSRELRQLAEHDNIGWRSVERANQRLRVTATRVETAPDGLPGYMWSLPPANRREAA